MDVHPPHEPVHSWRDALVHIGIMTVGLFIALMLEGLVEYVHHKDIVREARATIRQELESNHEAVQKDLASLKENSNRVQGDLSTLYALQSEPPNSHKHHTLNFSMQWNDLDQTAWTTARDVGALSYMPYSEVEGYAEVYRMQNTVTNQFLSIFRRETESFAPVAADANFDHVSPGDYAQMIHDNRVTYVDLFTTQQLLQELDQQIVNVLHQK